MAERSWTRIYDEGVPPSLHPYPDKTLLDVIHETARERPHHPALRFKGATLTYGELERLSDDLASAFAEAGVRKEDRIALLMPNSPQAVISQVATWKAGAIAAPMNPLYTESELSHALEEVSPRLAVVLTPFYEKLKEIQPRTSLERIVATNIKEFLPLRLKVLFTLLRERRDGHRVRIRPEDFRLSELLKRHRGAGRPGTGPGPEDPALLIFTGGTTGTPKAALGSHKGLLITGTQLTTWFKSVMEPWRDGMLGNMPLFHVYGNVGVFSTAVVNRAMMALVPDPRDLDDLLVTIEKDRPAFLPGVPTLFSALLRHPRVLNGKADLSSIKLCVSGAAPLLLDLKQRFEAATGGRMIEGWAMTETMMGTLMTPVNGQFRPGSTGVPLPDIDVRIVDVETGQDTLPAGEVGEILVRAPQGMMGYWRRPEATEEVLRDGWIHTGDIGVQDPEGYISIVDRKKDLIKPSGFQVWPREVEEVMAQHPAVSDAAVAGVPDPVRGESVKAWVILAPGHTVTEEELRAHCRRQLAGYKVPRQVEFCTELPRSAVGKVLRRRLVADDPTAGGRNQETAGGGDAAGPPTSP